MIKGFIKRASLEEMVFNTLLRGASMEEIHELIKKLNIIIVD